MNDATVYDVVSTGEILADFELSEVCDAFARLCNVSAEKAEFLLKGPRKLKLAQDLQTAQRYQRTLEGIGVAVTLQPQAPAAPPAPQPREAVPEQPESASAEAESKPSVPTIACPKCEARLPLRSEECSECGVILAKVRNQMAGYSATDPYGDYDDADDRDSDDAELNIKVFAAAAGAALLGALVWKLIAQITGYEVGFVAWAIGGGVGFAAAAMGGSGVRTAVVCGALAAVAIFGGKYWAMSGILADAAAAIQEEMSSEDLHALYDEIMVDAYDYANQVEDDQTLRQFMVDHRYSLAADADDVSDAEIEDFQANNEADLTRYAMSRPSYDEWFNDTVSDVQQMSASDMVFSDLGLIDLLFFALGIGTAFRLARNGIA